MAFTGIIQEWARIPLTYKRWFLQTCIIVLLSLSVFYLYRIFKPLPPVVIANSVPKIPAAIPLNTHAPLFNKPLFGIYQPIIDEKDIKQSMLSLQIVGIMYSELVSQSQVVLKSADGDEQTYVIGDTLPGGAVIKKITANGIVVLYNGELQRLTLPKNELIFAPPAKPLEQGI